MASYYRMIADEVDRFSRSTRARAERATRPVRAAARRYKRAFSQFNVFGTAAKTMGSSQPGPRSKPNYGRKR